jgi:hypothetical protein
MHWWLELWGKNVQILGIIFDVHLPQNPDITTSISEAREASMMDAVFIHRCTITVSAKVKANGESLTTDRKTARLVVLQQDAPSIS